MIRRTHKMAPQGTITAYADNAAIFEGAEVTRLYPRPGSGNEFGRVFERKDEMTHTVFKVETHNHPTAISPLRSHGAPAAKSATKVRRSRCSSEGRPVRLHDLEPQPAGTSAGF